ncbi:hypothetical protein E0500_010755 [Streptomyces sp. KM273126]|uniref:hypothetical protein n=1 Tax=Streptomyces sp. KM273126 TaxID=2545247 RepID=UPI00103B5B26|nr:hypothetical protein [Streptomyces sp. KM273126]MBA2807877.1 hypothetical protein [Streptomyces sp. KM273126]
MSVLTYLLTLPDQARVTLRALAGHRREGRSRIAAALRELEERRYLRRVVCEDARTGQLATVYEVFETPFDAEPPMGETEKVQDPHTSSRRTRLAVQLLLSLAQVDYRLALGAAEARHLAPLVVEWWDLGATSAQVRAALTDGWLRHVPSARAVIEDRLHRRRPTAPTSLPVTTVEVQGRRSRAYTWWALLKGRAAPA